MWVFIFSFQKKHSCLFKSIIKKFRHLRCICYYPFLLDCHIPLHFLCDTLVSWREELAVSDPEGCYHKVFLEKGVRQCPLLLRLGSRSQPSYIYSVFSMTVIE